MSSAKVGEPGADGTLIVPVDVVVLCIGTDDNEQATGKFAGATAVYSEAVQSGHAAFLGQNAARSYDDPPWAQLEVGAHLHWALPDGLTKGGGPGAELDFPAVPNRWLITRTQIAGGGTVTARQWLIESDAVGTAQPDGTYVTLPVAQTTQFPGGFAYLGAIHDVSDEQGWSEARASASNGGPTLAAVTGKPLNTVTNGEVAFAAYYPSCRGVLGFWDPLTDVTGTTAADPAQLAYTVVGWYSDPKQDPVQPGSTVAALEEARGWTWPVPAQVDGLATPPPTVSSSLYAGVIEGIGWSPDIRYVLGQDVQGPLHAQAAIGNTSSEALATYFAQLDAPSVPLFEELLDAFQSGLVNTFTQPTAGALTTLEERLHDQRYSGHWSGSVFSVVPADGSQGAVDLPVVLGDAVNQLNALTQQYEQCAFHADWFRWQLFTDWYRIFMIDPSEQNAAYAIAQQRYGAWQALADKRDQLDAAANAQRQAVKASLGPDLQLRKAPAERFVQPADPAVLVTGSDIAYPERYGGDGRFNADGYLVCRTDAQLIASVVVGGDITMLGRLQSGTGTTINASQFSGVAAPAGVPAAATVTALLREACVLNTEIAADLSGLAANDLQTALEQAMRGASQTLWTFTGNVPSPVEINWWVRDLWLPISAQWTIEFLPLSPTVANQQTAPYAPTVVTANFALGQDAGGTLTYAPSGGSGSIEVDPRTAAFTQQYTGAGHLSATPASTLANVIAAYLDAGHTDATLSEIEQQLTASGNGFLIAPLNGLSDALTMQTQGLQLSIQVPTGSKDAALTEAIADVADDAPRQGGPAFDSSFNPLRAGWMKLSLTFVDAFGQQRSVSFPELLCSDSMTTEVGGSTVDSVAYLEPRIAQPSRLAFHWLSADGSGAEELTPNPAVSPVCGWLLPNHLDGSLALYDGQGRALGSLFVEQDPDGRQPIGFQSAPGDDATIDEDLATVMAFQNPQLAAFANALGGPSATADFFHAMWHVIDTVGDTIDPGSLQTDSQLAVLVGRPVALVQAAVRLELQGAAMLDLGWDAVGNDTDAGLTGIEFPVVLGDLSKLADGLIGYFKTPTPGTGYDFAHFYSQGADPKATSGVVLPQQNTLTLTPAPPLDPDGTNEPPDLSGVTQHVLMLMDPRAAVHATTGILPTASISLPSEVSQATTSTLDLAFFTAPVLRGAGGLVIPTPSETGYALAYVDQDHVGGTPAGALEWIVDGDVTAPPSDGGAFAYSPQEIREGWIRFNPIDLGFALTDADGKPSVQDGTANALTLTLTNRAQRAITFKQGTPVAEGTAPTGSVFYVHLGTLVEQSAVGQIGFSVPGAALEHSTRAVFGAGAVVPWQFVMFTSPQYGSYWAAAPSADITVPAGGTLTFAVSNLVPSTTAAQAQVTFDYAAIDGIGDGIFADVLTVAPAKASVA